MSDSRYDCLFEPIKIGPVTAKNRFYQVPHCTGMGWQRPRMLAHMRGTKAEGGWGVVCTEWCSVHPSSDDLPYPNASLWDQGDIRSHKLMTEQVHEHGALAGVELWLGGARAQNLFSREVALDTDSLPNYAGFPFQSRAMDKSDIREVRRWHRAAALRAKQAEFDIVYVYATHHYMLSHFLSSETNTRTDEYGGSLENRVRLVRELIEDTLDAVGDRCAVAVRFSCEAGGGEDGQPIIGEHRDMLGMLAELPDLWDINVSDYSLEMGASRFVKEGSLETYMSYVKSITSKPVVTVGRFTSPDTMVSQLKRGITDFIGAARPSIADPFLPNKIKEGRLNDIRECIGCNICYAGDGSATPIHCTQNPTFSEGWRRGWHPEKIAPGSPDSTVLVIGGGPAGLEATRALGQRGYKVILAEASRELGGRVTREATLPGLSEWIRVRDYRVQQIQSMANVDVYLDSKMEIDDVLAVEADHIVVATGCHWRTDDINITDSSIEHSAGTSNRSPINSENVFTPDDILAGRLPDGPTLVYDTDEYYHASTTAEKLRLLDIPVIFVTPATKVSAWSEYTSEQARVQRRLMELGVELLVAHTLSEFDGRSATLRCIYTQAEQKVSVTNLLVVTRRKPNDALYRGLLQRVPHTAGEKHNDLLPTGQTASPAIKSIKRIGDCDAPALIATAVFAGHRYAQELDAIVDSANPMKYDRVFFEEN